MGLFQELRRRNVFRVAVAYVVIAWLLLQVVDVLLPMLALPEWVGRLVLLLLLVGFPLALVFAWAFELTPEGIRREHEVDRARSSTANAGRKLNFVIIGVLVVALAFSVLLQVDEEDGVQAPGGAVATPSIAVLPFENRSDSEQDAFFVDGIHDELLTQLAKIGSLKVISRTSVMEYRGTQKKIPQIARELGVSSVLEGGVQRAGDRVRIFAQLIDAGSDEHMWAETYDRQMTVNNLLDIQSEIARNITQALQAALTPQEQGRMQLGMTDDLEAFDAFLRARFLMNNSRETENRMRAVEELEFAVQRDPGFAAAWTALAKARLRVFWFQDPSPGLRESAWAAIETARGLEPDLADLHIAEGYYHYWGFRDYPRALAAVERARSIAPGELEAIQLQGYINRRMGNFEVLHESMQRSSELDPRNPNALVTRAETYTLVEDWDQASRFVERGLAMDPALAYGNNVKAVILLETGGDLGQARDLVLDYGSYDVLYADLPWWIENVREDYQAALSHADLGQFVETKFSLLPPARLRGLSLLYSGDAEAARAELALAREQMEERRALDPDDPRPYRSLCVVYGALGRVEEARESCALSEAAISNDVFEAGYLRVEVARGYALAGLHDQALDLIEEYLAKPAGLGPERTRMEPAFRGLLGHPRFRAAVED